VVPAAASGSDWRQVHASNGVAVDDAGVAAIAVVAAGIGDSPSVATAAMNR
jgi:hypothetical protein